MLTQPQRWTDHADFAWNGKMISKVEKVRVGKVMTVDCFNLLSRYSSGMNE
jgi:hypothetical protein